MIHPRTTLTSASALTALAAVLAGAGWGPAAGVGLALAGLLSVGSFALTGRRVAQLAALVQEGRSPSVLGGLLHLARLLGTLGLLWLLLQRFPPLAVLAGLSVVVTAIVLQAVHAALRPAAALPEG